MITWERLNELLLYDEATGHLIWKVHMSKRIRAGNIAGYTDPRGYVFIRIFGRLYRAHRLVWFLHHREWPIMIDHKDHNRGNNRVGNLRPATASQNAANSKLYSTSTSGVKGVSFNKRRNKWKAQIRVNTNVTHIGYYANIEEAKEAYNKKALEVFGEFANIGV